MNKVFLKGNVGQDPRITTFQDGGKVAQFTLATTERGFTTRDGKQIPDVTDWHNIVVKRTGLAGVCEQFVKKGTPLLIALPKSSWKKWNCWARRNPNRPRPRLPNTRPAAVINRLARMMICPYNPGYYAN